jgi:hypothetical protein
MSARLARFSAFVRPRTAVLVVALAALLLGSPAPARAGLIIIPTFDASITGNPNAAAIEAGINNAIAQTEATFTDPITVNITFQNMATGLGQSSTVVGSTPYATYRAALLADSKSADDATALASLPVQVNSPADGQANLWVTSANLRAVGLPGAVATDGTIMLNTSIMNLSRVGPQNGSFFDLQGVAQHEIDEVLGLGSGLNLPVNFPRQSRPQDLFRYSGAGVRSYTTAAGTSYFSIDGGTTDIVDFNQAAGSNGGDFGDWVIHSPAQVQDWAGTPGAQPNLGPSEIRNLDVIGYDLVTAAVPEPGTFALMGAGILALCLGGWRRRRRSGSSGE